MYEYVAVAWRTRKALDDAQYVAERRELDCQGWEVYQLAAWTKGRGGGVTIMRRPKDEPRMWTRTQIENIALNMVLKHEEWGGPPSECPDLDIEAAKEARGSRD